jgi:hypothetical protein
LKFLGVPGVFDYAGGATMKYSHVISEDERKIAARFEELLTSTPTVTMAAGNA